MIGEETSIATLETKLPHEAIGDVRALVHAISIALAEHPVRLTSEVEVGDADGDWLCVTVHERNSCGCQR